MKFALLFTVLSLLLLVNVAYAETGLVAHWKFDESSGITASDSSGNGITGTVSGASWVTGKSGNALSFSVVNDYVLVSDNDKITFSNGNFTVEGWFKLSQNHQAGSSNKWVLLKNGEYGLYLNGGNGNLQFYFSDSYQSSAKNTWDANTWYHVAGVHSTDGSWKIYVNGVADASGSKSYFTTASSCSFDIGNFLGCSYAHDNFVGAIDEVKLYSKPLTSTEILTEYQSLANVTQPADTTPPTVSITHSPSSPTTNDNITITATASDNIGISSVSIHVDNSNVKTCNSSPCSYNALYSAGSHTYYANATDTSGNVGRDPTSGTKSFTVTSVIDTTPPIISIISPINGSLVVTNLMNLNIETNENAICGYKYDAVSFNKSIVGTSVVFANGTFPNMLTTGSKSHSQQINLENNFTYTVTFNCTDSSGNSKKAILTFQVSFTQTTVATCPVCPSSSSWSACVDNFSTRTNYYCNVSTNYQCQSYTETAGCVIANITPVNACAGGWINVYSVKSNEILYSNPNNVTLTDLKIFGSDGKTFSGVPTLSAGGIASTSWTRGLNYSVIVRGICQSTATVEGKCELGQTCWEKSTNISCTVDSECSTLVCPQVIGSDTPRCISNVCQCGAKLVDKTVLLEILIQLETLKTSFVSLNNSATSLLKYYTSVNDTLNAEKWKNVTALFGDGVNSITDIQNYIDTVKDAPTQVDIQNVKNKIGNVLAIVDKIIRVILSG